MILFKLIRRNDDIVAANQVDSRLLVVREQGIDNPRVFVAVTELESVAAVIADTDTIDE